MKSPKSSLWQVMVMLVMIICLLGIVFVHAQEEKVWPAPEVIIKEWKQIHESQWQSHPYFDYHDYYYIDPSRQSHVEVACYAIQCPRVGGKPAVFVYRTKGGKLKFLEWNLTEKVWEDITKSISKETMEGWNKGFDAALKVYNEAEDCGEDCS